MHKAQSQKLDKANACESWILMFSSNWRPFPNGITSFKYKWDIDGASCDILLIKLMDKQVDMREDSISCITSSDAQCRFIVTLEAWTGLFWFTRSVCISHSHIIENIRFPAFVKKKYAVALSDGSSCWAAWKWLWFVRQVCPCAVTKEPAVALTPTGCRIIGILPGAFSLF